MRVPAQPRGSLPEGRGCRVVAETPGPPASGRLSGAAVHVSPSDDVRPRPCPTPCSPRWHVSLPALREGSPGRRAGGDQLHQSLGPSCRVTPPQGLEESPLLPPGSWGSVGSDPAPPPIIIGSPNPEEEQRGIHVISSTRAAFRVYAETFRLFITFSVEIISDLQKCCPRENANYSSIPSSAFSVCVSLCSLPPFSVNIYILNRLTVIWRRCASLPPQYYKCVFLKTKNALLHNQRCRNEEINLDKTLSCIPQTVLGFQQVSYLSLGRDVFSRPRIQSRLSCVFDLPHLFGGL